MSETETQTIDPVLTVSLDLPVPAARAFEAWTTPEQVERWWGGWDEGKAPAMTILPQHGEPWRFAMAFEDRVQWVSGEVLEVDAPHRIVFTFAWEGLDQPATPVELRFADAGEGRSTLTLVHDQTAGGKACADGWSQSLGNLAAYLATIA